MIFNNLTFIVKLWQKLGTITGEQLLLCQGHFGSKPLATQRKIMDDQRTKTFFQGKQQGEQE